MCSVPKPYPKEFRDDVVNVARRREPGQTIKQVAADFGIAESCLRNWMRQADVEDGVAARHHRCQDRGALVRRSGSGRIPPAHGWPPTSGLRCIRRERGHMTIWSSTS
ncbi:transposase [Actinopolymorpha pittospori]|uniref:transposase n=1 Tax=Actinopolymorpha pittospori TaxID=648752 RepID=UPI003B58B242